MLITRTLVWLIMMSVMVLGASVVHSQSYPIKPVRIVTGAAGGGSDFVARLIADGIAGPLGQPVIVDNRGGGVVSAEAVSKAAPDGYTLLMTGSTVWILPMLSKVPYDVADLAPISLISIDMFVVAVHPSLPVKSIKELIALAKSRPGELMVSAGSAGSPSDLGSQLLKSMAGINILSVRYRTSTEAVFGVVSGEVHMTVYDAALIMPQVKAGKLRVLAVTSSKPSILVPGVPTVAEAGLPGYESVGMNGFFAPVKTPGAITNQLYQEIVRVLNKPDVKDRLYKAQNEVIGSSPEEFAAAMKADIERKSKIIREAGIKAQ